jgi:aspartokinase-like uncharacterized kinase
MWVIKIGGSLTSGDDALLPRWLELVAQLGGGRTVLVAGGGALAGQVRAAQVRWRCDDLAAHNMAVLAMAQNAYLLQSLQPALQLARGEPDLRNVLRRGRAAVWLPFELLRERADETTSWEVTSDSIALGLAKRLRAERLVIVKSCAVDGARTHAELAQAGVLDARFASLARGAPCAIDIVERGAIERVRALLIGGEARVGAN